MVYWIGWLAKSPSRSTDYSVLYSIFNTSDCAGVEKFDFEEGITKRPFEEVVTSTNPLLPSK